MACVLAFGLIGCGGTATKEASKQDVKEETQKETAAEAFTGEYMVNAEYVKEHLDDIVLIDARGDEAAAKGTIKGAIPVMWQFLATCEDGVAGDENWGCILDLKR